MANRLMLSYAFYKAAAIDLMSRGAESGRTSRDNPLSGPRMSGRTMSGMPKRAGKVVDVSGQARG